MSRSSTLVAGGSGMGTADATVSEALRLSEERLRVCLQSSPAVVFDQDLELRYTWIHNPKPPLTTEAVLGKTDFDLLPAEEAQQSERVKRRVIESGVGARVALPVTLANEGYYYDLVIEPLRDHAGRIVGITCAAWDVTDRRREEVQQRFLAQVGELLMTATPEYETTLTQLANFAVPDLADWVVIDVVEAGQPRRLAVACSQLAQRPLAETLENVPLDWRRPHLTFEPLDAHRPVLMTEVSPENLESLAQHPEHLRVLRAMEIRSVVAVPLLARGRLLGALALLSSRASRRYRERDLRFAEELARVAALAVDNAHLYRAAQRAIAIRDEVMSIVAHDLRNPLQIILMQCALGTCAAVGGEPCAPQPPEVIQSAANRMKRLIQDLLDVTSMEAGRLRVQQAGLPVAQVVSESLQAHSALAASASLELRVDLERSLPKVWADRDRLLQVFENLLGNAIKFTRPGGRITIGAARGDGEVLFWVSDTGSGIPEQDIPQVFDRFWQARSERLGTGLGLPIAKGIVEAHRGRIWLESRPGRGTTFYFTMPVAPAEQARVPAPT